MLIACTAANESDNNPIKGLAKDKDERKSLLKVFQLEDSHYQGVRVDIQRQERSAQLQLTEAMPSESILDRPALQKDASSRLRLNEPTQTPFLDEHTNDRIRKYKTRELIKNKLLNQSKDPFAQPDPPKPRNLGQIAPDRVYESLREARQFELPELEQPAELLEPSTQNQMADPVPQPFDQRRFESEFQDQGFRREPPPSSDYPNHESLNQQQPPFSVLDPVADQEHGSPTIPVGTHSSSVSAVISPGLRHTPNGIEFSFSDVQPFPNAGQPIQQDDEAEDMVPELEVQQDQDVPDWDSILRGDTSPDPSSVPELEPESMPAEPTPDASSEPADTDLEEDLMNETTEQDIDSAREIESIEKKRERYRQALRRPLSNAPAQLALQYLDDEGESVPSSADQKFYLLQFNGYRYSNYYNNECRVERSGNSWCPMYAVWQTPNLCYNPLYFEEVNLERFGARSPGQSFISAAHFFSNVVTLPYAMGVQPPHCCYYSAGYGRPGNKYCYLMKRPVWSLRGATMQSLLITGLAFGLP